MVSGSYDNSLRVWDLKTGNVLNVLDSHNAQIYAVVYDGRYVCSGSLDADVRIWNAVTGQVCATVFHLISSVYILLKDMML